MGRERRDPGIRAKGERTLSEADPSLPRLPHPGVRLPPPVVYATGVAAGWLLHLRWPLALAGAGSRFRVLGIAVCIASGLALATGALAAFRRARTTMLPHRPAAGLVTSGPYRFTRNPMYVSLVLLYLAAALWINSWWPIFLLPLVALVIQRTVIAREERYLAGAFTTEYAAYRRRVRRWL